MMTAATALSPPKDSTPARNGDTSNPTTRAPDAAHRLSWSHHAICSKSYVNGPYRSPLPLGAILKEGSESEKWQKSEVPPLHAQTFVCKRTLGGRGSAWSAVSHKSCCESYIVLGGRSATNSFTIAVIAASRARRTGSAEMALYPLVPVCVITFDQRT